MQKPLENWKVPDKVKYLLFLLLLIYRMRVLQDKCPCRNGQECTAASVQSQTQEVRVRRPRPRDAPGSQGDRKQQRSGYSQTPGSKRWISTTKEVSERTRSSSEMVLTMVAAEGIFCCSGSLHPQVWSHTVRTSSTVRSHGAEQSISPRAFCLRPDPSSATSFCLPQLPLVWTEIIIP